MAQPHSAFYCLWNETHLRAKGNMRCNACLGGTTTWQHIGVDWHPNVSDQQPRLPPILLTM